MMSFPSSRLCTKNTSRALIERPYSCAPQAVGAVYDRPGFFVQSPSNATSGRTPVGNSPFFNVRSLYDVATGDAKTKPIFLPSTSVSGTIVAMRQHALDYASPQRHVRHGVRCIGA